VLIVEDVFYSPHISQRIAALFPARSLMGLPLIADGRKLGAALIAYNHLHSFTPQEIALAEEVRTQISLAMTKIRLLDLERRRADELEALQATVTGISSERDLPSLLQAILERAASLLRATGGDLVLYDPVTNDIEIVVCHNMGKDYTGMRMAYGEGALGHAVELCQPVVIDDYQKWDGRSELFAEIPYHAVLAVPLLVRGRILGALGVVDRNPRRKFTQEDQRLLYLFSQQAATAMENARLYTDEKRSASELGLLFESSTAMVKTLDLHEIYNIATDRLARAGGATSARILSCDLENGQATVLAEYASTNAGQKEHISDVGITYDLGEFPQRLASLRAGRPLSLRISSPDLGAGDRRELTEYGIKSALNLPMLASDRVISYAEIWDSQRERVWTEEEIQFYQTLANQVALVIENARLYNQMQHLAVTDTLTGVYNRRGLLENGQPEINRSMRNARLLAVIMLDIDNFKQVNDNYSHTAGDQVLQALALLCQENLREADIIGRYGGEEFAILLTETDEDGAYPVAQRLRQSVAETPITTQHGEVSITVSVGIACNLGDNSNLAVLLDMADTAMYEAKRAGRNLVRLT
jgi:diguanylate cyclase (GGDEF)-like protein